MIQAKWVRNVGAAGSWPQSFIQCIYRVSVPDLLLKKKGGHRYLKQIEKIKIIQQMHSHDKKSA